MLIKDYDIQKSVKIPSERIIYLEKLIEVNPNNYESFTELEKINNEIASYMLRQKKFDSNLFPENIFLDQYLLLMAIIYDSVHLKAFKTKITDVEQAKGVLRLKELKEEHLMYLSDDLLNDKNVMFYLIYNKPHFFKFLRPIVKENKEINALYMNSECVQWEHIENINKTKWNALLIISNNLVNISKVIEDFPNLKNNVETLEAISRYLSVNASLKSKNIKMFEDTFTCNDEEFLNIINKSTNLNVSKSFIKFLSQSKFSNLLSFINKHPEILNNLSDKDNNLEFLKTNMRQSLLLNKLDEKELNKTYHNRKKI